MFVFLNLKIISSERLPSINQQIASVDEDMDKRNLCALLEGL